MLIEVCDICRKEISEHNGIYVRTEDFDGLSFCGDLPVRAKRKYKIHICERCVDNIKKYCKKN